MKEKYIRFLIFFIKTYLFDFGSVPVDVILAQAKLETADFTSRVYKKSHNLFGMRFAKVRPCVAIESGIGEDSTGQAVYSSDFMSIYDYFLRQEYFKVRDTEIVANYMNATFLTGFSTDPAYVAKWGSVYKKLTDKV